MRTFAALAISVLMISAAAAVAHGAEPSFRDCSDCPSMIDVPGGSFQMGSSPDDISRAVGEGAKVESVQDETPQHGVRVKPFAMSVTEVTRDQFDAFVRATGHQADGPCDVWSNAEMKFVASDANDWRDPGFRQTGNHPVVCVGWSDAKAYVRWLSQKTGKDYRLPSEAQWEFAARAGTSTPRPWGYDNASGCRYANAADFTAADALGYDKQKGFQCADGHVHTAPVAQFQANGFGLNDMLGNVWEWTDDCYNTSYKGAPSNGSAWSRGDCSVRVLRGGSWSGGTRMVRSAERIRATSAYRGYDAGFRVARTK